MYATINNYTSEVPIPYILPEKSRLTYESAFSRFDRWCEENNMKNIDETTLMTYFEEKAKVQKSSSLWSTYSMLKTVISTKNNIDISNFKNLLLFLKKNAVGYQATKTKALSRHHVDRFLREADDTTYLLMKVILIIGVAGSCKKEELTYLRVEDVKDEGSYIRINISRVQREFVILDEPSNGLNPVAIIRKYAILRPTQAGRFFVAYRNGKCINQPVGVHTVGALPKKVASYLGLPDPDTFTGYCSKKSAPHRSWPSAHFVKQFDDYF